MFSDRNTLAQESGISKERFVRDCPFQNPSEEMEAEADPQAEAASATRQAQAELKVAREEAEDAAQQQKAAKIRHANARYPEDIRKKRKK